VIELLFISLIKGSCRLIYVERIVQKYFLLFVILLMTGSFVSCYKVNFADATGIIYIRADGSIDPPTAPIVTADNFTYTFTSNFSSDGDGIVVERNNIVIDGAGCAVGGTGIEDSRGVCLYRTTNVTVQNMTIHFFYHGLYLHESSCNSIVGNNLIANTKDAIRLFASSHNNVSENGVTGNRNGVWIEEFSSNNTVFGNRITSCFVDAIRIWGACNNNTVFGNEVTANIHSGIWVCFDSYDNNVSCNNVVNTGYGIMIGGSSYGNAVIGNYITANVYAVILEESSHDNAVLSNNVVANSDGIALDTTFRNSVSNNNVTENVKSGILLYTAAYNNTISDNDITKNGDGLRIRHSSNNVFYHNSIANNTNQVFSENSTQTWDDGYPSGGNYWSGYVGSDQFGGPVQDLAGSDGIGDTPYVIDSNNRDGYPLTKPYLWDSHDVGITSLAISGTLAKPQIYLHINITVFNYGSYNEVFNVTVYANTTAIGVFLVNGLLSKTCVFIGFTWNATGSASGNCSIRAEADTVKDETDTVDNSLSFDKVYVGWITGDVDGNGLVNLLDLYFIALCYGTQAGEPTFSPDCDINTDGKINMLDLYLAAIHYGERSLQRALDLYTTAVHYGQKDPDFAWGCCEKSVNQIFEDSQICFPITWETN